MGRISSGLWPRVDTSALGYNAHVCRKELNRDPAVNVTGQRGRNRQTQVGEVVTVTVDNPDDGGS